MEPPRPELLHTPSRIEIDDHIRRLLSRIAEETDPAAKEELRRQLSWYQNRKEEKIATFDVVLGAKVRERRSSIEAGRRSSLQAPRGRPRARSTDGFEDVPEIKTLREKIRIVRVKLYALRSLRQDKKTKSEVEKLSGELRDLTKQQEEIMHTRSGSIQNPLLAVGHAESPKEDPMTSTDSTDSKRV
eukprot:TRINITY_DN207_c0_g2_i2.p1 TRINITY_DN207_c0_g2~~TRINITY_DN207_c0_g2_i2.p1  ORF type:complete len:187 (+),score=54.81 TRINITY_DN207_c0_g2_i2:187-747(+)